jgi:hypothetical protein
VSLRVFVELKQPNTFERGPARIAQGRNPRVTCSCSSTPLRASKHRTVHMKTRAREEATKTGNGKERQNLQRGSSCGWKRTSFTAPLWPGNLCRSFPVRASHMATLWSPLPAAILSPFASQLALSRLRSWPVGAPSYVWIRRSAGAKGRTSHVRTVESCALDKSVVLSGESCNDVTVSV